MLASRYFHTLCDPRALKIQVQDLLSRREPLKIDRPYIVWEPAPLYCIPENLNECLQNVSLVDVFSPNHLELLAFFGHPAASFSKELVQTLASCFLDAGVESTKNGIVIVRAGEHGCLIISNNLESTWLQP
jgi:hypothetical protein